MVEEACRTGGFGGELSSTIQEQAFDSLDGPVGRIGAADVPIPYSRSLEAIALPDVKMILKTVEELYGF